MASGGAPRGPGLRPSTRDFGQGHPATKAGQERGGQGEGVLMAVALASDPVPETSAKATRLLKQVNWLGGAWVPGG